MPWELSRKLALSLGCGLVSAAAAGQTEAGPLVFEQSQVEVRMAADANEAVASFNYRNRGSKNIGIVKVEPSCDCVRTKTSVEVIGPGESGVLSAFFSSTRSGDYRASIAVTTSEADEPIYLAFKCHVDAAFEVRREAVQSRPGAGGDNVRITLVPNPGVTLKYAGTTFSMPGLFRVVNRGAEPGDGEISMVLESLAATAPPACRANVAVVVNGVSRREIMVRIPAD